MLEKIEVGGDVIELPKSGGGVFDNLFGSSSDQNNMAIFDSGTTLAFLPPELQEQIVKKVSVLFSLRFKLQVDLV